MITPREVVASSAQSLLEFPSTGLSNPDDRRCFWFCLDSGNRVSAWCSSPGDQTAAILTKTANTGKNSPSCVLDHSTNRVNSADCVKYPQQVSVSLSAPATHHCQNACCSRMIRSLYPGLIKLTQLILAEIDVERSQVLPKLMGRFNADHRDRTGRILTQPGQHGGEQTRDNEPDHLGRRCPASGNQALILPRKGPGSRLPLRSDEFSLPYAIAKVPGKRLGWLCGLKNSGNRRRQLALGYLSAFGCRSDGVQNA